MLAKGLSYRDKNKVRRLSAAGHTPEEISRAIQCEAAVIRRHIEFIGGDSSPASSDKFGPLPDSLEWRELSPGARSGLTRKRINAAKAE